jgi:hypothetical protein
MQPLVTVAGLAAAQQQQSKSVVAAAALSPSVSSSSRPASASAAINARRFVAVPTLPSATTPRPNVGSRPLSATSTPRQSGGDAPIGADEPFLRLFQDEAVEMAEAALASPPPGSSPAAQSITPQHVSGAGGRRSVSSDSHQHNELRASASMTTRSMDETMMPPTLLRSSSSLNAQGASPISPVDNVASKDLLQQRRTSPLLITTTTSTNITLVFQSIMTKLSEETETFSSFANACETAMTRAEVACEGIEYPRQLEASVASALLLKLTPLLGSVYGPLVHRIVLRLMLGTFSHIPETVLHSTPATQPTNDALVQLVQVPSFGTRSKSLRVELDKTKDALKSSRHTLLTNTSHLFVMAERNASGRLRLVFDTWRSLASRRKRFDISFTSLRTRQQAAVIKRESFLRWLHFVQILKNSRVTNVASSNHDRLNSRVVELQVRCSQRDEQLNAQRVAKEKFAARCERLEELYNYEKEELSKVRSKLVSMDQEVQRFRSFSVQTFQVLDRLMCSIPLFLGSKAISELAHNSTMLRDLNIRKNAEPIRNPVSTLASVPTRLRLTSEYTTPYHVHTGGSAELEGYVDDAIMLVTRWVTISRDDARQFIETCRAQKFSASKDVFGASMDEDDLFRAQADSEQVTLKPVRDFGRDLADGRLYQLVLWRIMCHRFGNTAYLDVHQPIAPYPSPDSAAERMEIVVRMAKVLGVDGGRSAADWLALKGGSVEARRQHFLFCVRIMTMQATCTPHFTRLFSTRQGHAASAMTATHVQQLLQSINEKLDVAERWNVAVRCVNNYAAVVANGAPVDIGSHRTPTVNKEFCIDKQVILEQTLPQSLRFAKEAASSVASSATAATAVRRNLGTFYGSSDSSSNRFQRQLQLDDDTNNNSANNGTVSGGDDDDGASPNSAQPQYQTQTMQAATFLWSEMNHILSQHATEIQRVAWHYAAYSAPDVAGCNWDTPAWMRFTEDARLHVDKHVPKYVSDAVFRSLAAPNPQTVAAAIVALQPAQLQPRLSSASMSSAGAAGSPNARGSRPGSAKGRGSDAGVASSGVGGGGDDGDVAGGHFYLMPITSLPTAIARLFLARSLSPPVPSQGWTEVDRAVELFRMFVQQVILSPQNVPRSLIDDFVTTFQQSGVQDLMKVHREPLRKLFNDLSSRDTTTQLSRIRLDAFVQFSTREVKLMPVVDVAEVLRLYQTCRIGASLVGPLSRGSAMVVPGLDLNGFVMALMLLSRIRFGFPMLHIGSALQQLLTTVVFPAVQFRLKLKWGPQGTAAAPDSGAGSPK